MNKPFEHQYKLYGASASISRPHGENYFEGIVSTPLGMVDIFYRPDDPELEYIGPYLHMSTVVQGRKYFYSLTRRKNAREYTYVGLARIAHKWIKAIVADLNLCEKCGGSRRTVCSHYQESGGSNDRDNNK